MKKFLVEIDENIRHTCLIEAESKEEAEEKGHEVLMNGADDDCDNPTYVRERAGFGWLKITEQEGE